MNAKGWSEASDEDLISEVVRLARTYKGAAIREAVPGVTEHDISRWRDGGVKSLNAKKRLAILSALEPGGGPYDAETVSPYDIAREEEELARVAKEPDPVLRALERESIGSVIRAQALREIAWGNRIAEQTAARREEFIRGITSGRKDVVGPVSDEAILRHEAIDRGLPPERSRASGE